MISVDVLEKKEDYHCHGRHDKNEMIGENNII